MNNKDIRVKTQYKCKIGSRVSSGNSLVFIDRFIEGKWYDVEYRPWWFEDGYKLNNGHYHYWVINEQGLKEHVSRAQMNMLFYIHTEDSRDQKINEILK